MIFRHIYTRRSYLGLVARHYILLSPMVSRIALVTGAAQGIGEAISLRLADEDINVALLDLHSKEEQLKDLAKRIEAKGRRALVIPSDVTVEDDVQAAVSKTTEVLGGLDIVSAPFIAVLFCLVLSGITSDGRKCGYHAISIRTRKCV